MFGGNSYMHRPGGFGRGPGHGHGRGGPGGFGHGPGHRPGGFGPRGPMRPHRPHRPPHFYRRHGWGRPPYGGGCMGCLLPILSLFAMIGGAIFLLLMIV